MSTNDGPHDLLVQHVGLAHSVDLQTHHLGVGGDVEAGGLGDHGSVLAHQLGVGVAVVEQHLAELLHVGLVLEEHHALRLQRVEEVLLSLLGIEQQVVAVAQDAVVAANSHNAHLGGLGRS